MTDTIGEIVLFITYFLEILPTTIRVLMVEGKQQWITNFSLANNNSNTQLIMTVQGNGGNKIRM